MRSRQQLDVIISQPFLMANTTSTTTINTNDTLNDDGGLTTRCFSIWVGCHIRQGRGACWKDFVDEVLSWCDCYSGRRLIRLRVPKKRFNVSRIGTGRKRDNHVIWTCDPRIRVNCLNKVSNDFCFAFTYVYW